MKLQLLARVAFWLATLAVLLLTLLPAEHLPSKGLFDFWDKAQHALAFAMLSLLALVGWPQAELRWRILLSLLALGGAIEVAQHVSGWRHGEWADWGADVFGVVLATIGFELSVRSQQFSNSDRPQPHIQQKQKRKSR